MLRIFRFLNFLTSCVELRQKEVRRNAEQCSTISTGTDSEFRPQCCRFGGPNKLSVTIAKLQFVFHKWSALWSSNEAHLEVLIKPTKNQIRRIK